MLFVPATSFEDGFSSPDSDCVEKTNPRKPMLAGVSSVIQLTEYNLSFDGLVLLKDPALNTQPATTTITQKDRDAVGLDQAELNTLCLYSGEGFSDL